MNNNIFHDIPKELPDEITETLVKEKNIRIERIVSKGHMSDEGYWYDQAKNEWVILLKGKAKLEFENETLELEAGDYLNIPANKKHRVSWTDPTTESIWLAIFY